MRAQVRVEPVTQSIRYEVLRDVAMGNLEITRSWISSLSNRACCDNSVCPPTECSTLGSEERIRVPSPAASTMVRQLRPFIRILVVSASNVAVIKLFLSKVKTANLPEIEQVSC